MKIIDTHTHMYLDAFDEDRDQCMRNALDNGVVLSALPNIDLTSIDAIKKMCSQWPEQTIAMMGLHPCSVDENYRDVLNQIETELRQGNYHGVGEIGIDLYWDKTFVEEQKAAFRQQIQWAKECSLPIVIHARDSFNEIFEILDQEIDGRLSGVFHCFTGDQSQLEKALSYPNFFIGLGGVLTFKKSGLDQVVKHADLNRIVLETDAPYLSPSPFRGKRNQTAYTRHVAQKLAEVFELPIEQIAEITTANALRLFKIDE